MLHGLTHSFPTRRSSDLIVIIGRRAEPRLEDVPARAAQVENDHARMTSGIARRCATRSEEHTSELQSLMRIPYAVFCLKKKRNVDRKSTQLHSSPARTPRKPHSPKQKQ